MVKADGAFHPCEGAGTPSPWPGNHGSRSQTLPLQTAAKARAHCETHRKMSTSFAIHQQSMVNVEIKLEALLSEKPRYKALGKS